MMTLTVCFVSFQFRLAVSIFYQPLSFYVCTSVIYKFCLFALITLRIHNSEDMLNEIGVRREVIKKLCFLIVASFVLCSLVHILRSPEVYSILYEKN